MMRKGFMLIEMLAAVVILATLLLITARLFSTLMRDVPRAGNAMQVNISLLKLVEKMQYDIEYAPAAGVVDAGWKGHENVLQFKADQGFIGYTFDRGGRILRFVRKNAADPNAEITDSWQLPTAEVKWHARRLNDSSCIEVEHAIKFEENGKSHRKLANAGIFFFGSAREDMP